MCSYCRTFVPNYSIIESPLRALVHTPDLRVSSILSWTVEAEDAFVQLKLALQSPPTLGIPDPLKSFTQAVDERDGCMTSVLLQKHGDKLRPVAYFSALLDPVARGFPRCLRAIAAAEKALVASRDIVGYSDVTLLVPHAVSLILLEQHSSHLSASRYLRYHTCLLDLPNVTIQRCNTLNPASLMPLPTDGDPHDCVAELSLACTPRPDLSDTPLPNPDLVLFVDGSGSRDERGTNRVGYAVVTAHDTLSSSALPHHFSAQTAELVALTAACKIASGKRVNIYTDSRYAFGVVHDFGALWRHRKFLRADGKPILNHVQVADLLDAILLPSQIAVCKCSAHTSLSDPVSKGNASADAAAKAAAYGPMLSTLVLLSQPLTPALSLSDMQSFASDRDRILWRAADCTYDAPSKLWTSPDGRPCLPSHFFLAYAKITHAKDHVSKGGMVRELTKHWFTRGFTPIAQAYCERCPICLAHNISGATRMTNKAAHPPPDGPFQHLMMDFIELTPAEGKKYCLVIVDMWSKWVEAFPVKHQDARTVAKILTREIIPRWGLPLKISSDNGSHFSNEVITALGNFLGIDMRKHCAYHPASGGAVERENLSLKNKLVKCCEENKLNWVQALPLVLMYMRMRVRARSNLSPFEILFAAPARMAMGPPPDQAKLASTTLCEHDMLDYCLQLSKSLSFIKKQVKAALPVPASEPLHNIRIGDYVLVKDFRRKSWKSRRWQGPYQVLLTTHTAVKVAEGATWVHASHCKKLRSPNDVSTPTDEDGTPSDMPSHHPTL